MHGIRETFFGRRGDPVLFAAVAAAGLSALLVPPSTAYFGYLDLSVLSLLLSLMLVVAGLKKSGAFRLLTDRLLESVKDVRALAFVLVGVCFFGSMMITNDVALITFVPLGVLMLERVGKQKFMIRIIVLQTLAANLGSMATPLGNPQNLYLYSVSGMAPGQFLRVMALPSALSFLMLAGGVFLIRPEPIESLSGQIREPAPLAGMAPWGLLFLVCLMAVLHMVPFGAALAAVLAGVVILDRSLILGADYGLLSTFACLFVFVGNINSIPAFSDLLRAWVGGREMAVGVLLSQVISNVPAAMLLSKFTADHAALLIGVNLGGLGTVIASMASVISYKQYAVTEGARPGRYLAVFTAVNLLFLGVLWMAMAAFAALV